MSVDTVTVQNTGEALGELAFPNKETFKSKNNIASLDDNGKLILSQAPYTAGSGIKINNLGVISATGGGSGGDEHNAVTSTAEVNVAPTSAQTATAITGALEKPARVIVVPKYTNIGAVYVKETNTYSSINPIYPDPVNNVYEFANMQNVKVFVDSLGDSVDLVIEYRG